MEDLKKLLSYVTEYDKILERKNNLLKFVTSIANEDKPMYIAMFFDKKEAVTRPSGFAPGGFGPGMHQERIIPLNEVLQKVADSLTGNTPQKETYVGSKLEYKLTPQTAIRILSVLIDQKDMELSELENLIELERCNIGYIAKNINEDIS